MFQASLGGGFGAQDYGLRASIKAAIAYDELCSQHKIELAFEPQAIVIMGRVPPEVARRVRRIIVEIAGSVPVWDRTFWLGQGQHVRKDGPCSNGGRQGEAASSVFRGRGCFGRRIFEGCDGQQRARSEDGQACGRARRRMTSG